MRSPISVLQSKRRALGGKAMRAFFEYTSAAGRASPPARKALADIDILRDIPYGPESIHRLDVYRPKHLHGPAPTVLYIHGGGFRILSKDTHWIMGLAFARMGAVVFSIDYRLAPKHPFPAAAQDSCRAAVWVQQHAHEYGGDVSRLAVAGESAGANLACVVGVASAWRRPEPWAAEVFDAGVQPKALFPACGLLQATDVERIRRRRPDISRFVFDRLLETGNGYVQSDSSNAALADPLCIIEEAGEPDRPLAPMFIPCGTKDPLLEDSRRLARALDTRGVANDLRIYPGGVHAFHAFAFRKEAQQCWRDHRAFFEDWI